MQSCESWTRRVTHVWRAILVKGSISHPWIAATCFSVHISSRFCNRVLAHAIAWGVPNNFTRWRWRSTWTRQDVRTWIRPRAPKPFLVLSNSHQTAKEMLLVGPVHSCTFSCAMCTSSDAPLISMTLRLWLNFRQVPGHRALMSRSFFSSLPFLAAFRSCSLRGWCTVMLPFTSKTGPGQSGSILKYPDMLGYCKKKSPTLFRIHENWSQDGSCNTVQNLVKTATKESAGIPALILMIVIV